MRLRVAVMTSASSLPWESVLAPGRGVVYDMLGRVAPELGVKLHREGWGVHAMAPFGHSAPVFARAPRKCGAYATGGQGHIEFGSPLPEVIEGLYRGFHRQELLDWGGTAFRLTGLEVVEPPGLASGRVRWRTATPVVMKGSGRDGEGTRTKREAWVLPTEPEWPAYMQGNLRRKAETLGLDTGVELEGVTWIGRKRSFHVGAGLKPGASVEVELSGPPETLRALWSWGLGQANSAGFGWVRS